MAQDKKSPLYTLYESLKADNYDVPDTYESFERTLTASGKEGTNNRVTLYNSLRENNYDVPDTYESFANTLFVPVERPEKQTPHTPGAKSGGVAESLGDAVKVATAEPVEPMYTPGMKAALADSRRLVERMTPEGRKRQRNIEMSARMAGVETTLPGITKMPEPKVEADDKGASTNTAGGEQAPMLSPEVAGLTFDENGNAKAKWQLGTGRVTSDILEADAAEYRARESRLALQRQRADMTVGAQLQRALEERKRLDEQMKRRKAEIDARKAGHPASFIGELANNSHSAPGGMVDSYGLADYSMDEQYRQLESASRKNNETIQTLSDKMGGQMDSFWHSLGTKMADGYTLTDGLASMNDAISLMDAKKRLDEINRKRGQGEDLTQEEEAAEAVLKATIINDDAQARYGSEYGAWARAGMMLPGTLDMMKDIMLTPGAGTIAKGIASGVSKGLGRAISKVAGDKVAENIAARFITKATGIIVGAHASGAVISNTAGINHTMGEAGLEFAGDVEYDDKGNYIITSQNSAIGAMLAAERNQIRENGSEMFGEFIPGLGGVLLKGIEKIGLKRLSGQIKNIGTKTWYNQYSQLLKHGGFNGLPGEGIEEYEGYLFDALTGHMSDAVTELSDLNTHIDIWLGCATTSAILGGVPMAAGGMHTAQYYRYRHKTKKSDTVASETLGADRWAEIRDRLDYTPNEGLSDALTDIIGTAQDMTAPQKVAVMDYVRNLVKMRGYNIAQIDASEDDGGEPSATESINDSFRNGYTASTPQEMADAQNMYELQRKRAVDMMGEENLTKWVDEADPVQIYGDTATSIWSDEERDVIRDYINAKIVRDGMIQRVNDDIDEKIAQSNAMVDLRTNKATGVIQPAVMGLDDRQVYIVSGNIVTTDTGAVDLNASDDSIVVCDAKTGRLEFSYPKAIKTVGEAINPEEEKSQAAEIIRQQFAQAAVDKMNGVLTFNPGEVVPINDGNNTVEATIVGPAVDQTSGMPVEGQIVVQYPGGQRAIFTKEQLQAFADADNLERLNGFEQNRAAAARAEAKRPKFDQNDEFTLLDDNGRPIRGSIVNRLDEDGNIEISTEDRFNGLRVQRISPAELEKRLVDYNGEPVPNTVVVPENVTTVSNPKETATEPQQSSLGEAPTSVTALSRIPVDEHGKPNFEAVDSDTAWDAIVEKTANEKIAQSFADNMVANAEAVLKSAEKAKTKASTDIDEFMEAENERLATIERAKATLDHWKAIAGTTQRRESERRAAEDAEARRRAQERAEEEARLKAEREEAERIEREALSGVPDWNIDTPADARARGYRRNGPQKVDRPEVIDNHALGNSVEVKFGDDVMPTGNIAVIEASQLQPSHRDGQRNPAHFLDEAQPKERKDAASRFAAAKIAETIRPEEITSSVTAYTGAPSINSRGEVIQGNNRSEALRIMYERFSQSADKYKQYLIDHAAEFGLTPEAIAAFEQPVLVNMLEVSDEDAITLGQYVAQDTESGGIERIKPKNAVQKMGDKIRTFANLLLRSSDDEATFAQLVDANGIEVLKWMNQQGYITNTQYASAFDSKGNLSAEAANDLKGIMYQSIFTGGSTRLEEMFNKMPAKAQRAILATAFRDYDSPFAERMINEIQQSIIAFNALMAYEQFRDATTAEATMNAVEAWKVQFAFDDVTGESYLPSETFSNFALALAAMYKGNTQKYIQSVFNMMYDIVQGTEQDNLFEAADKTPKPLAEAIRRVLNIEYQPIVKPTTDNGSNGSPVLDIDSENGQDGRPGSNGNPDGTEQAESKAEPSDGGTGAASDSGQGGEINAQSKLFNYFAGSIRELIELARGAATGLYKKIVAPISERLQQDLASYGIDISTDYKHVIDNNAIRHALKKHGIRQEEKRGQVPITDADFERIEDIVTNYDNISIEKGKRNDVNIVYSKTYDDGTTIFVEEKRDGRKELAAITIWKKKNSTRTDANHNVTPISDLNEVSGDKGSTLSLEKQEDSEKSSLGERVKAAETEVDTNPTEGQKEAGNYKKGHVRVGSFDITIEQPVGSERTGKAPDGTRWKTVMKNAYGYIRGTEGVDGDHIDVFLSTDIDAWNGRSVVIVDQYNPDGTFDEHKVMLGFNDKADAINAYLANYEEGWEKGRRLVFSTASLEDFEKWIESSHRKQKPYHEYKIAEKAEVDESTPEKETQKSIDKTTDTGDNPTDLRGDTALSQNSGASADKGSTLPTEKQDDKKASSIGDRAARIEDFGEKIAGARKDALSDIAKSVENVTVQSLIELPLSKAFKRPSLKKLVDSGAISDEDAILAEAVMQSMVYAQKKPVLTRKPRSKREIAAWAQSTYEGIKLLGEVLSGDAERKAAAMAAHKSRLAERLAEANVHIAKMREWNPGQRFDDLENYPDPISIIKRVLEGARYRPGDKVELPLTRVELTPSADRYDLSSPGKQGAYWFKRYHETLDSAIDTMILAARLSKGDMDVELPQRQYSIRGVGNRHKELTGKYVVQYIGNKNAYDFREEVFATEEKAREYAEKKNGRVVAQERYTNDYDSYAIVVINPLTGNAHQVSEPMDTRAEVTAWLDEHPEEVNAAALDAIYKETGSERSEKEHFYVSLNFSNGKTVYSVVSDDKTNPWPIVKDFRSRKEAEEWLEANKVRLEAERKARKEKERAVVYYDTAKERLGEDYRHGKDATPEMFGDTFGFRGVQFGNWTNDADRQEGLNQAYDALMDMARALGITPRAVSLDGELGLAFGARGSGRASAHYEPTEVVINLTKTRGAGTLAHEWWHAVDNFLSRRACIPYGYASHLNGVEQMHPEVRDAIEAMMSALSGTEYSKRSALKGDYWDRSTEMMARLFETWLAWRLAKDGGRSPFLASGTNPKAIQMYQTLNYLAYRRHEMAKAEREGRKPELMTQDEFNQKPASLYGYPYPIEPEVEQFAPKIEAIFTALVKREQESGSLANSPSRRYGKRRGTVSGASLFDWADSEERRLADEAQSEQDKNAEAANSAIDRYCEAFKGYAERTAAIENRFTAVGVDSAEAAAMREQLEYEESAILEARSRLEEALRDYYIQGNSAEDASRIARDMVYRVQAEVTSRLDSGRVLRDILEQDRKPQLSEDPTDVKGKEIKTSGGVIAYDALGHLPDPKEGEFGYVERRFSLTGEFGFTGNERIRDRGDVAYLFRSLENYGVEHVFAVLVKDGKYKVIHLGMGSPTMSAAYMGAIRAGYDAFGADKIYLVHNHPSGNLISSPQDRGLMRALEQAFDGVEAEGIIMDTTSGRYHIFDSNGRVPDDGDVVMEGNGASVGRSGIADRPREGDSVEAEVVRLDRLESLEVKDRYESMSTPAMVEQFISNQRLGTKDKLCYMVLTNNLEIVGNFHTGYKSLDADGLAEEMASVATKYGGTRVIVYGNMPLEGVKALSEEVKRRSLNSIALTEVMSVKNGLKRSAYDEGLLRDGGEAYQSEAHEPMMSDSSRADFDEMLERAVSERGIVMPGLNEATVKVVEVPRHDFTGTGKEALMAAETWGKAHITGIHTATDSQGVEFEYSISNDAVEKYVSRSATGKSANIGVHLAALKMLPEIIGDSIEAEVHPDYTKKEGARSTQSKVNQESLIHRFYGAANIDGTTYRVKTTMREYKDENRTPLAYSYEITQIELLEAPSDGVANNSGEPLAMTSDSSISAAKLLQGVEKSYDPGVKILEASEKSSENNGGSILDGEAEEDVLCRPVTDKATLDRLNNEQTIKVYRAMQMIDGGLRPPMSGKVDGQWREATEVGVWEEAEEHPEMADENGRFKLDKGNGKSIKAAYNPYIHTSRSPINDQFSSAWSRPELVTVEVEIPESELTSGYRAEKANAPVGEKDWKSGPVSRALAKIGQARRVILSRWSRIIRVVPVEEVAEAYAQRLNAHGIEVPFNTVPPALREALAERGVKIGKPEKGNAGKASMPAFEQWIMEQERQRQGDGYGAYTDAEVSFANDPVSKVMGKNRFSKKRQAEFISPALDELKVAARERQRMVNRIGELADKLHLDNVEILTDASQLEGKRAKAKGFYNKRTGKITIVIPNNVSTIDAEQTLLHEAVAHYGLRQLFGEQFNTFLDNVYQSADESIRRKITEMAAKNGWDFRTATEEYLAGLAEDTNFNEARSYGGWWSQIKRLFLDMLEKIGFEGFRDKVGVILTDNELRYILWRSYENLAEPGRYRSILGEAADIAKQSELKVGNYAEQGIEAEYAAEPSDMSSVNEKFNEQLNKLSEDNADKIALSLGRPSSILLSAGVEDRPLKLYGNKIIKKMKKHGFALSELRDLPDAVAHPIAVFNNLGREGNRSILTELRTKQGNILVTIDLGVDQDVDFNIVSSVFGKRSENVIAWILKGMLVAVDKEKALNFLSYQSAPIAATAAKQELISATKVVKSFENPTIEDEELFRHGDFTEEAGGRSAKETAREEYDRRVRVKTVDKSRLKTKSVNFAGQLHEAYLDSMRALGILQEAVSRESGMAVQDFEDAYTTENHMSSRNQTAEEVYKRDFFEPMCKAVVEVCKGKKEAYRELLDYIIAKHGLERNAYMRSKAVADGIDQAEADATDYSGLTSLTKESNVADAEAAAERLVKEYEVAHDTAELWRRINAATRETLRTRYQGGLLNKEVYEKILGQYQYYIPLKGWSETTAVDVYEYAAGGYGLGSALMTAYGRNSLADDPLATIMIDAQRTIMESNRNIMKQKLLNLALNHHNDLLTVSKQWFVEQADGTWLPDNPTIPEDADADIVDAIVKQHEADMLALEAQGKAVTVRKGLKLGLIDKSADTTQHVVKVKRNGETFCIYVNGDPRAARAINGMLNPDSGAKSRGVEYAQSVKNFMSKAFTTWNPEFIVGNLSRDVMFAGVAVAVKEDGKYVRNYTGNITSILAKASLPRLLYKWEHGTLDDTNETERYFKEFLMNGGETGFTQLNTVEKAKRDMQRFLREAQGGMSSLPKKAWRGFWSGVEFMNRSAEDTTRFAVYMTSRQQGRSVLRSIHDAKEITVNFNKKGSGAWGARYLNFAYVFFNAAMQSLANAGRLVYRNPGKASAAMGIFISAGLFMPMVSHILAGLCGGDGDDYWNLPEWVRRNNIILYIPFTNKFITIPISHELRPFYGMGEIVYSIICGKENIEDGIWKAVEGFTGILPVDTTGNGGDTVVSLAPTILQPVAQIWENVDYFGNPIYKKTPWNADDPEWTKAYIGTNGFLVDLTKMLSEAGSTKDEYDVIHYPKHWFTGDINPAWIEHLIESYTGGFGKTIIGAGKTVSMLWNEDARELRNVPIVRKFIQSSDGRAVERRFSNEYFKLRDEYEESKKYLRKLNDLDDDGAFGVADRVSRWLDTEKGTRYYLLDEYFKNLRALQRKMNEETDTDAITRYRQDMDSIKRELVNALHDPDDYMKRNQE